MDEVQSQSGIAVASSEPQNSEAIRSASASVVEKHMGAESEPRKKRPYHRRVPYAPRGAAPATPDATPVAPPPPPIDPTLVAKTMFSLCEVVDGVVTRRIVGLAVAIGGEGELARNVAGEVSLTKEEKDIISNLSALICQKYNMLGQYAPELMLGAVVVGYSVRVATVTRKLNQIAAKVNATRAQKLQAPDNGEKRDGQN